MDKHHAGLNVSEDVIAEAADSVLSTELEVTYS